MTETLDGKRVLRTARLRWVPIEKTKVSPVAQRELNQHRVDEIAANFDPEQIGAPTVNQRDGWYYIIDGQHRIEAMRLMGWSDQSVQCWTYDDLTEEQEAEYFLRINNTLTVETFERFRISIKAGREIETDIDRIVRGHNLRITRDEIPGAIRAVGTLRRVYTRSNPKTLARTLRIIRDAYGDAGLAAPVIDGIGLLCHRYNGQLDDSEAVKKLGDMRGGVNGLLGNAEKLRLATGNQKSHCVAAAAVDVINRGRGAKKLPSWWAE